jgi:DNA invertase Pin-like site-specific DNA recombinase
MPSDAVIYARYSSDLQREASIHDQTTACREYAVKHGWNVVGCYDDPAVSGASVANRPGVQRLMAAAKSKRFSVVVVHAIDRLGRRLADLADIYDQLRFLGIELYTPEMGQITHMHIAIFGMMAQARLRETGSATKAGQFGRVDAGKIPSGIAYGYRALPGKVIGKTLERGEREIIPAEAAVIQRIFEEYANGKTPEAIAKDLNAEGVPGPTGEAWLNTTIRGPGGTWNRPLE